MATRVQPVSRQEYWSGLPCPPLGDRPNPGIEPTSPSLQTDSLPAEPPGKPQCTVELGFNISRKSFLSLAPPGKPIPTCGWLNYCGDRFAMYVCVYIYI